MKALAEVSASHLSSVASSTSWTTGSPCSSCLSTSISSKRSSGGCTPSGQVMVMPSKATNSKATAQQIPLAAEVAAPLLTLGSGAQSFSNARHATSDTSLRSSGPATVRPCCRTTSHRSTERRQERRGPDKEVRERALSTAWKASKRATTNLPSIFLATSSNVSSILPRLRRRCRCSTEGAVPSSGAAATAAEGAAAASQELPTALSPAPLRR
mmetsp:Transcript_22290/g.55753  ORF Transcript_22290/g.55753 Transcript_22290/m.55753 type:complete len:213 (+) Transcript_22290:719-1357(+)